MLLGNGRGKTTKTLSLCEKLQLIEDHECKKLSARKLAVMYGVGKTQVYDTLKNKHKIRNELLKGTSGQRKRLAYVSSNEDVNNATWEWLSKRMAEGISASGPMIQAHALKVAQSLGKKDFKASNGWLECFRSRHNIVCYNQGLVGANDVIVEIEEDRKQSIVKFAEGYWEENIFVAFETSLCYKVLPMAGDCTERLGVLLCMNMKGTILKPLVVGKIARPKAFGKLDASTLPVQWRPSSRACMTTIVLEEWLHCLNEMMILEERMVILYLNNISCNLPDSLSNVKLVGCSPPMEQAVVFHFKCLYRKLFLQTTLLKVQSSVVKVEPGVNLETNVSEACTSVTVLDAVNGISRAVCNIPPDLVRKSFVKSGFTPVDKFKTNNDAERSLCAEISELCSRLNLDPENVIQFDDNIPEDPLRIKSELEEPEPQEQQEEKMDIETYSDAIKAVKDLEKFAAQKNCPQLLSLLQDAKDALSLSCLSS